MIKNNHEDRVRGAHTPVCKTKQTPLNASAHPTPTSFNIPHFPVAVTGGPCGFGRARLNSCTKEPHWASFDWVSPLKCADLCPSPHLCRCSQIPQVPHEGTLWSPKHYYITKICFKCTSFSLVCVNMWLKSMLMNGQFRRALIKNPKWRNRNLQHAKFLI